MKKGLGNWLILTVVVVLLVGIYLIGATRAGTGEGSFGGTDSQATSAIDQQGYHPWAKPLFEPGSAEIESGLFAAQALVGGLILGYCLGSLRTRRRQQADPEAPVEETQT